MPVSVHLTLKGKGVRYAGIEARCYPREVKKNNNAARNNIMDKKVIIRLPRDYACSGYRWTAKRSLEGAKFAAVTRSPFISNTVPIVAHYAEKY